MCNAEELTDGVMKILQPRGIEWLLDYSTKQEHITEDMVRKAEANISFIVMTSLTESMKSRLPPNIYTIKIATIL